MIKTIKLTKEQRAIFQQFVSAKLSAESGLNYFAEARRMAINEMHNKVKEIFPEIPDHAKSFPSLHHQTKKPWTITYLEED